MKLSKLCIITFFALCLVGGSALAAPFTSSGWVNPNFENSWDDSTLTGTALYSFDILEDWVDVNSVEIEFENDIFDLGQLGAIDFTVLNPAGWSTTEYITSTGIMWSISYAGTNATSLNDPIQISVDYTLLNAEAYNHVSGGTGSDSWTWDEGQAWGQAYTLAHKSDVPEIGLLTADSSPGSTVPTPEPATMLLLGTGLVGLAGFGRKKFKKK